MAQPTSRRGFLTAVGLALATPGAAVASLGRAPSTEPHWSLEGEEGLARGRAFARVQPVGLSGWCPDELLRQGLTAVLWSADAALLSPNTPEGRARAEAALHVSAATALELSAMRGDDFVELDWALQMHPEMLSGIQRTIVTHGRAHGVPESALFRYRRIHADIAWRLQRQGSQAVIERALHRAERVWRRQGLDWHKEAKAGDVNTHAVVGHKQTRTKLEQQERDHRSAGVGMAIAGIMLLPVVCVSIPLIVLSAVQSNKAAALRRYRLHGPEVHQRGEQADPLSQGSGPRDALGMPTMLPVVPLPDALSPRSTPLGITRKRACEKYGYRPNAADILHTVQRTDPERVVRHTAALGLNEQLRSKRTSASELEPIMAWTATNSESYQDRHDAAWAIGLYGSPRVVGRLLSTKQCDVRSRMVQACRQSARSDDARRKALQAVFDRWLDASPNADPWLRKLVGRPL